ncbi:MAG: hypothetical protein ABSC50_03185 [Candidatus Bathyarchaeia archaeon]|jgi:hypothetical protein
MPNAGDIDMTHDFFLLPSSKNATATITKGQIISLKDGRPWQAGDKGPFGIANQGVASGADMKGKIVVDGVVWVAAGGAINQFSPVVPSDVDEVSEQDGYSVTVSGATGTGALLLSEIAYDAAAQDGDLIRIDL